MDFGANPTTSRYQALMHLQANSDATSANAATDTSLAASFEAALEIAVGGVTVTTTPPERTVEDVKREFYDFVESLPIHPMLYNTPRSLSVSEGAFERMLNEPEFMEDMKDTYQRAMNDPNWSALPLPPAGIHTTITDGSDGEDPYHGKSWGSAWSTTYDTLSEGSFWSSGTRNDTAAKEAQEKRVREKRELNEIMDALAAERRAAFMAGLDPTDNAFRPQPGTSIASWFSDIAGRGNAAAPE